jgi:glycosyltransferase involved in cell wall biosynthesis
MSEGLHVLVYGGLESGVTDALRIGMFREPLAALGVDVRSWTTFREDVLNGGPGVEALDWADAVLFRRWRPTHLVCTECETAFGTLADLEGHVQASGHRTMVPDTLLRAAVELAERYRADHGRPAIVYDADDDVLDYPAWTGFAAAAARERDLVERILGLADVVTVATPVLASRLARRTRGQIRVVRNAVDPRWYITLVPATSAEPVGDPRVVYHGVPVRLRDYGVARPAVDAAAAEFPSLRRVWLGAAEEPRVAAAVDEVRPWVDGLAEFGAALLAARPHVGLAPLLDEPFNRAKSELHWLEYSMAGAATIVSGFDGPGPYDVVRDGTDGLVSRRPQDWLRHLRSLAGSPSLREELAGRARERALAEYTLTTRAAELADVYSSAVRGTARPGSGGAAEWPNGAGEGEGGSNADRPGAAVEPAPEEAEESPPPPASNLRVLVIGPGEASVSDALRFGAFVPVLAQRGIELATWSGPPPEAAGADEFDELSAVLGWANVVVLRRTYRTIHACLGCDFRTFDRAEIRGHAASDHEVVESPFALVRPLVGLLESQPDVLGDRALVYETDDDVFSAELREGGEDGLERDLVARMIALADLVTVTTPVLAETIRELAMGRVRIIRNAVDPAWYEGVEPDRTATGEPRVVYQGVAGRLADYEVARSAVDSVKADRPGLRRVWLGATGPEIEAVVDETRPWVRGLPEFAAALVAARPHVGLAPLVDSAYSRGRSELHWLEYAMAGAPVVATKTAEPGPYDPIRDGVDGLLAAITGDWERHLRALAASRDLRAELAGRARERVLAEYTLAARADEWAAAYRWAAANAGLGRKGAPG